MTNRQLFVDYVKRGGERHICSPQIGAGAGFDTKMAGKQWIGETTLEDTIACTQRFDMVPLINIGLPDAGFVNPALGFERVRYEAGETRRLSAYQFKTPVGVLSRAMVEDKRSGCVPTKFAVEDEDDLPVLEWYLDGALEIDMEPITAYLRNISENTVGERGALSVQWGAQPYELLSWPSTVTTMFLANDCPEAFTRLMDKILKWDIKILDSCQQAGVDFVFLGAPAAEIISPRYYEQFIVPYSRAFTQEAHRRGLLIYSHICSPIEPMLSLGYYNQMGIDLFETLSMKPVGNVSSLQDALSKLDPAMCTRGNVGLDVLLTQDAEAVRNQSLIALEESAGRKHILAASDYLFYDIPAENVEAMCAAAREF